MGRPPAALVEKRGPAHDVALEYLNKSGFADADQAIEYWLDGSELKLE